MAGTELKALLWDVDGTLAETERDGHRLAFNQAFDSMGLPWRWDEAHYGRLLAITGGRERLLHDLSTRSDAPTLAQQREALAAELHQRKNRFYADLVAGGGFALRGGVRELMAECSAQGVAMAITTTTSRSNVQALMAAHFGPSWPSLFGAVVCGEDVHRKKPDPAVFEQALQQLKLGPLQALAIEDSPGGVAAARAAHVPVLVTLSAYFENATLEGAIAIGPGLDRRAGWRPALPAPTEGRVTLADLRQWHAAADNVSQYA